jgi:7-carboxy-7-deazaguanine synthase
MGLGFYMLPINEMFETIQGEGVFTGVPAVFIRLQGCPVGCAWCDTKHTWEVDKQFKVSAEKIIMKTEDSPTYFEYSANDILQLLAQQAYSAKHIVLTGGEPCLYNLTALTHALHAKGFSTQIETSGTFEVLCDDKTWVTLSPKVNMQGGYKVLDSAIQRANEIKHPVAMQKHIDDLDAILERRHAALEYICLQPISQQARATQLAIETCIKRNWRLSLQTHKYLGIA